MKRPMHKTLVAASLAALLSATAHGALAAPAKPAAKGTATPAGDATENKPVAIVNGKAIPQARMDALLAAQLAQGQQDTPQLRLAVREELVRREILAQEADKQGFANKLPVQAQMMMARQSVLIGAYLQDLLKSKPITDEMVKKEYENIRKSLGEKEYKTRHVLVESEDEAKAIIEKLKKGEKFEELAKQSKDPGSKEQGGDLGWSSPAAYVPQFSAAMIKLEKGKFTEAPVKSDFGWHVIQIDDTREMTPPSFEEIKPQLQQRMQQQMVEKQILDLRAKAKVE